MQNETQINELKKLTNTQLLERAKQEVKAETSATLKVLYTLREIERRRAFAEKKYPSLFEFCTEFLGYKRDAAYRRITAMRALKDLPEVEEKIQNGSLSLTTLAQAHTIFSQKKKANEPLSKEQKLELIGTLENKSTREAEKIFLEISPQEPPKEKIKSINEEVDLLSIPLPKRLMEKIERMKMYMGPEKPGVETWEAIEEAFDIALLEKEKTFRAPGKTIEPKNNKSTVSIHLKRQLWKRDQGQCTHRDPKTGEQCESRYKLEIDHVKPKALGGTNDLDNLRLVCRSHNQWAAIQLLGFDKMESFIN